MESTIYKYDVLGLMSGTSLDGLDMVCVRFSLVGERWSFRILASETVGYTEEWRNRLSRLFGADGAELAAAHAAFGRFSGECVAGFVRRNALEPLLVASHGHTVFHQPERGFTLQIGDGGALAEACGLPVVSDFRVQDVALGGQGAPLVPVGDALLFPEYDACLNIGGISNISFQEGERRIAFDISPANQLFNFLAGKRGLAYDKEGALAACGKVDGRLLARMNALGYYSVPYPKSLGREWVEAELLPLLDASELPLEDLMATAVEHSAIQISSVIRERHLRRVLLTGGGAKNTFLRQRMAALAPDAAFVLPDDELVDYKEALVFAFLGLLRWLERPNCLRSVTGASRDHCAGAVWMP